jgi:hypothetical protein
MQKVGKQLVQLLAERRVLTFNLEPLRCSKFNVGFGMVD